MKTALKERPGAFAKKRHLEKVLQAEMVRLWHEVGRPDTNNWQTWTAALVAVVGRAR